MIELDLDEIKRVCAAASEPPWLVLDQGPGDPPWLCSNRTYHIMDLCDPDLTENDKALIVNAATWLPALVAEVERLRRNE